MATPWSGHVWGRGRGLGGHSRRRRPWRSGRGSRRAAHFSPRLWPRRGVAPPAFRGSRARRPSASQARSHLRRQNDTRVFRTNENANEGHRGHAPPRHPADCPPCGSSLLAGESPRGASSASRWLAAAAAFLRELARELRQSTNGTSHDAPPSAVPAASSERCQSWRLIDLAGVGELSPDSDSLTSTPPTTPLLTHNSSELPPVVARRATHPKTARPGSHREVPARAARARRPLTSRRRAWASPGPRRRLGRR